ncbi:MAG TPA: helix-turn-helix domain-containing protein [Methanocella sp.]|uniref:TrmB family transcriptional regulator n=1 Tax=Methanocella sp. TaxID=2052833 RepID=UPI002C01C0EA|nr:helix-turn-helix domain-containing protein [Methanocella sp.]HTY91675.1 helix-turn-helix domain-containing protein [Methanocella sp.]
MNDMWTVDALKRLGLTEYEAKVYVALNHIKVGTASDVHMASDVPRSAIYGALAKLEEKGLVEVEHGKPMRYRSIDPVKAIEKLRRAIDEDCMKALKELEEAHARGECKEQSESVWTVRGGMNLYNKLSDMVSDAERNIILIATDPMYFDLQKRYPIFGNLMNIVRKRIAAGVRLRVVCVDDDTARRIKGELPGVEVKVLDPKKPSSNISITGGVLMVDDAEVLFNITGGMRHGIKDITAIHTRMDSITSVLRHFTEMEWDGALSIKSTPLNE